MGATTAHDAEGSVAEELPDEPVGAAVSASTELAPRARRSEVIRPLDADQLVQSFAEYQELLPKLLRESDYQEAEAGKKFVKKSGWRKIGAAFDLDVRIIAEVVERDDYGRILRAKTTARATAPSGRVMDGDGYCTIDEFTGRRANNPKLENDLRGTAATRAKNRAISDLVGMGEVSAEEVETGGGGSTLPAWATPASDGLRRTAVSWLRDRLGDDEAVKALVATLRSEIDPVPVAVARTIVHVCMAVKEADIADVTDQAREAEAIASEHGDEPEPSPEDLAASAARVFPDDDIPF